ATGDEVRDLLEQPGGVGGAVPADDDEDDAQRHQHAPGDGQPPVRGSHARPPAQTGQALGEVLLLHVGDRALDLGGERGCRHRRTSRGHVAGGLSTRSTMRRWLPKARSPAAARPIRSQTAPMPSKVLAMVWPPRLRPPCPPKLGVLAAPPPLAGNAVVSPEEAVVPRTELSAPPTGAATPVPSSPDGAWVGSPKPAPAATETRAPPRVRMKMFLLSLLGGNHVNTTEPAV